MGPTDLSRSGDPFRSRTGGSSWRTSPGGSRAAFATPSAHSGLVKSEVRASDPLSFAFVQPGELQTGAYQRSHRDSGPPGVLRGSWPGAAERQRPSASAAASRRTWARSARSRRSLNSVRRREYVLLFSEGFESRMLMGNAGQTAKPLGQIDPTQDTAAESSIAGQTWKIDSDARFGSSATRGILESALSGFRRADVVLDTIDISGLRAEGEVTRRAAQRSRRALHDGPGDQRGFHPQRQPALRRPQAADRAHGHRVRPRFSAQRDTPSPAAFHELKVKVRVAGFQDRRALGLLRAQALPEP